MNGSAEEAEKEEEELSEEDAEEDGQARLEGTHTQRRVCAVRACRARLRLVAPAERCVHRCADTVAQRWLRCTTGAAPVRSADVRFAPCAAAAAVRRRRRLARGTKTVHAAQAARGSLPPGRACTRARASRTFAAAHAPALHRARAGAAAPTARALLRRCNRCASTAACSSWGTRRRSARRRSCCLRSCGIGRTRRAPRAARRACARSMWLGGSARRGESERAATAPGGGGGRDGAGVCVCAAQAGLRGRVHGHAAGQAQAEGQVQVKAKHAQLRQATSQRQRTPADTPRCRATPAAQLRLFAAYSGTRRRTSQKDEGPPGDTRTVHVECSRSQRIALMRTANARGRTSNWQQQTMSHAQIWYPSLSACCARCASTTLRSACTSARGRKMTRPWSSTSDATVMTV
jgi:hypothetical protein